MPSHLAGWRVSLLRARADWPIVAAAWLTMLLATTLLAAGPIYASAVSLAGLRQTLADAPVEAANVQVSIRVPRDRADAVDRMTSAELERVPGSLRGEVARTGTADVFALPGQGNDVRDLAVPAFADGVERHATLLAGAWPAPSGSAPGVAGASFAPVPVAVSEPVADQLELAVGDRLDLVNRLDPNLVLPISIGAVFRIDDPSDPFWWADALAVEGLTVGERYRTFGPFLMARADLLARAAVNSVTLSWRLLPDATQIGIDDVAGLRARLDALPGRLHVASGSDRPIIVTELPQTLATAERALLVSRTGVLLLMAQLAILGGYSILLTTGLLIDHRRVETALLRSRGAGPGQVGGLAVIEGLLLVVPAVLLGPWLAVGALGVLGQAGPLGEAGLEVTLQVTSDAYLAAAVAGAACVALLAVPAVLSARAFSAEQRFVSRQETRPLAQRLGIDLALLAAAGIALWQLRLYGAPLTRTVQGAIGIDPLLVAAPALGLLAGAVVAIRTFPRLAEGAERLLARGRGLVGSLGTRQLARRPLRYTRSALLLMLAMSMGVFAVAYGTTWTDSQRDQADHQVGADVRVIPSRSARAVPTWALASAYAAVPRVAAAMPVERDDVRLTRSVRGTLLALDAGAAAELVRLRADQAAAPLPALLAPLAAGRPNLSLIELPVDATGVVVDLAIEIHGLERIVADRTTQELVREAEDPAAFDTAAAIRVGAAVRDAHGLVHRFWTSPVAPAEARAGVPIPFAGSEPAGTQATSRPDAPLGLVSLDVTVGLPDDLIVTDGTVAVAGIGARAPGTTVPVPVDLRSPDSWRITRVEPGRPADGVPDTAVAGFGVRIGGTGGVAELDTAGTRAPVTISMQPDSIADLAPAEIPVLVSQATLAATALVPGETLDVGLAGADRRLRIVGVVATFPTVDPGESLVIMDLPTLALLRLHTAHDPGVRIAALAETQRPDEWWLETVDGTGPPGSAAVDPDAIARALVAPPLTSADVDTVTGRFRSLVGDPAAVGIIGALSLGAVAAALFAIIALAVGAAVSARQRQTEFALLRALGLSRRQLAGWLWLENGSVALVSLVAGTALGVLISWVVLPSVTVSREGIPPTPPVLVNLPLATIAALELGLAAALATVVVVMAALLRRMGIGNILRLGEE